VLGCACCVELVAVVSVCCCDWCSVIALFDSTLVMFVRMSVGVGVSIQLSGVFFSSIFSIHCPVCAKISAGQVVCGFLVVCDMCGYIKFLCL